MVWACRLGSPLLYLFQEVRQGAEPKEMKKMNKIMKFIETMMILFGAVLLGVPVVSLIAAPMAISNLVCAGIMAAVFVGMAIFTIKTIQ